MFVRYKMLYHKSGKRAQWHIWLILAPGTGVMYIYNDVKLITHPRRFGKTLSMSMTKRIWKYSFVLCEKSADRWSKPTRIMICGL